MRAGALAGLVLITATALACSEPDLERDRLGTTVEPSPEATEPAAASAASADAQAKQEAERASIEALWARQAEWAASHGMTWDVYRGQFVLARPTTTMPEMPAGTVVTAVTTDVVQVGAGCDQGVKVGGTLLIRRGNDYVALIEVRHVDKERSWGVVRDRGLAFPVQVRDTAVTENLK